MQKSDLEYPSAPEDRDISTEQTERARTKLTFLDEEYDDYRQEGRDRFEVIIRHLLLSNVDSHLIAWMNPRDRLVGF